ncbi:hypothetical protein CALVIDRAFT_529804 [Calocera viscosa TUFC12733]|uniref:Uncharacterized protein n=1 Tax=Calocera viscosa (strain TUFC12733) TaxID=1330018 RepID=A0A167IVW8_CALVF|nr:hypothetical protein CALVIDRAFT_529804 [Calocera viscosa TUFC12733]
MSYPSLKIPEKCQEFREWCTNHPLDSIKAWYKNKLGLLWYLPSINMHESPMDRVLWATTPRTSNSSKISHVQSNMRTDIHLPLLTALSSTKKYDQQVAERIQSATQTCILSYCHNSLQDRLSCQLGRAKSKSLKAKDALKGIQEIPNDETVLEKVPEQEEEAEATSSNVGTQVIKIKLGTFITYKRI